jgi:hypothetical protein
LQFWLMVVQLVCEIDVVSLVALPWLWSQVCLVNGFLRWLLEQTNWVNGGTWKLIGIVDCWILCWFGYCLSLFVWFLSRLISFDFFLYCSALFDSLFGLLVWLHFFLLHCTWENSTHWLILKVLIYLTPNTLFFWISFAYIYFVTEEIQLHILHAWLLYLS